MVLKRFLFQKFHDLNITITFQNYKKNKMQKSLSHCKVKKYIRHIKVHSLSGLLPSRISNIHHSCLTFCINYKQKKVKIKRNAQNVW